MKIARFASRDEQWAQQRLAIDAQLIGIEQQLAAVRRMLAGFDTACECERDYGPVDPPLSALRISEWLTELERALRAARLALPEAPGYDGRPLGRDPPA